MTVASQFGTAFVDIQFDHGDLGLECSACGSKKPMALCRFRPHFWLWAICFQTLLSGVSGVSGEHASIETHGCNQTDALELFQIRRDFPSDCFVLEDHYHIDHGVLTETLRFGPGGNAGPSNVKCIASKEVKEIVGSLSVTGALSLTSILLPRLERVQGSLIFMQLPKLEAATLQLDALKSVNENLVFRHNKALSTLSLRHLRNVDRTLEVMSNQVLETLLFDSLACVGLHLLIESNPGLTVVAAPSLKEIRWDLIIGGNDALEEIQFQSLEKIGEDLVVYVLDTLKSIHLPLLSFIGEDAEFAHLLHLQHLRLPELKLIGEDFEVHHCYSLESVSMPSLQTVKEDVEIHNLPVCASISMPVLSEIDEDLEMYNLGAVNDIDLPSLKIIWEDLFLGGMPIISDLSMPKLTKVEGSFWLYNMPNLSRVDFANVANIGGKKPHPPSQSSCHYDLGQCDNEEDDEDSFYITNNTRLEDVWMPRLVSIRSRYFAIFGNAALVSVRLPRLSKFSVPERSVSCSLTSLFGVFRNEALETLELNEALSEPRYWTFNENAPSFCPSGPQWATNNCSGGTVSAEDAEEAIFGCQCKEAGFEDSFEDGFCRQAQCPQYVPRRVSGTCSTCYDADGCLILSRAFMTVPDPVHGGQAINGSILLTSEDPLLTGVKCIKAGNVLTSINGCLAVQWSPLLESINFEKVIFVKSITISGNAALHQIAAPSLEKINLDLVISGNSALLEFHFPYIGQVDGRLSVEGHPSLKILELPTLSQAGSFFLASTVLEQFHIPNLQRTSSHIRMWQLNKVTSIDLPSLEQVGEDLMISFCSSLESLNVAELLDIIEDLEFYVLHSLKTISFPRLMHVGEDLEIYTNDALSSVSFASLKLIGEDLEFFDNSGIFNLDQNSFPNLEHVEEDFEVYVCAQLVSLDVPQLRQIDEDLILFGNPLLKHVTLPLLEDIAAREGGGILMTDNLALTHFELPSLRRVGNSTARAGSRDGSRDIRLYTGAPRWQVRGQEGRPILIAHNPKLTHVNFPQLEVLQTGLWIQKNSKLQSIELPSLEGGFCNQFFVIRLNPLLGKGGLQVDGLITGDRCFTLIALILYLTLTGLRFDHIPLLQPKHNGVSFLHFLLHTKVSSVKKTIQRNELFAFTDEYALLEQDKQNHKT